MAISYTKSQSEAISSDGSVIVSAAAGSGKTAVLAERVLRLITDKSNPVSADRLLIVTFTNDAAAEMRSRIEKKLYESCLENPDDRGLLRQKYLLQSADICTIDSFCINLVRDNFELCGVSPDFKVGDGSELNEAKNLILKSIFEKNLNGNKNFDALLDMAGCNYNEENLLRLISDIYDYSLNMPFPDEFLNQLVDLYKMPFDNSHPWYKMMLASAKETALGLKEHVKAAADASVYIEKNKEGLKRDCETLSLLADELCDILREGDWDRAVNAMPAANIARSPSLEKDNPFSAVYKSHREEFKKSVLKLKDIFEKSRQETENELKECSEPVSLLCGLIKEFSEEFFKLCIDKNYLTFALSEQLAFNLLCENENAKIRERIISRYDEVLVDEFQDVNDLQSRMFEILSDNGKHLFTVGDVKQSIYGFRGSNPDNFIKRKENGSVKKIILAENFRSRKEICDFTNFIFEKIMDGRIGKIVYDEKEALKPSGNFKEADFNKTEIILADAASDTESDDEARALTEFEAIAVADKIKALMNENMQIEENGNFRALKYSDITVLLPTVSGKADYYFDEFSARKIPVALGSEDFFETYEISLFVSLLKTVDNPKSDVDMLCVMMSPIFGFSPDSMAQIRAEHKNISLYSSVIAAAKGGDKKCGEFLDSLKALRLRATVVPCDKFAYECMERTELLSICSALSGGDKRRKNLLKLLSVISDISSDSAGDLSSLLKRINGLKNSGISVSCGDENCVTLKSMHKSKGLQFPVCIVAGLSSKFNNKDTLPNIIYDESCGLGIKYIDFERGRKICNAGHKCIAEYKRVKNIEERIRLLYVAMTRAKDRLILVCSSKNMEKAVKSAADSVNAEAMKLNTESLKRSDNMQGWILSSLLMHPSSKKIKKLYDVNVPQAPSDFKLDIEVKTKLNRKTAEDKSIKEIKPDTEVIERIKKNFSFVYPYEPLSKIRAKASVSLLANKEESDSFAFTALPSFAPSAVSGAKRGTAVHKVMQFFDFNASGNIEGELERLKEWQFITEEEFELADRNKLELFFKSEIFKRIKASVDVRREMRFLTELPASELEPSLTGDCAKADIIVQGAVDLCFVENGGVVVVDFKTDRVKSGEELAQKYKEQISIYSSACEKIFGMPVKEKILYSFALSKSINV